MGLKAILYTAFLIAANTANAADVAALEAMREGTMKKLRFVEPVAVSDTAFTAEDGSEMTLAEFEGRHVLLNFWATWCAPCRKEMPMLSELQSEFGGDDFAVVTIATGRNPQPAIDKFFDEIAVENLPKHLDPRQALSRDMAVLGLPVTILIDPDGNEIARMTGDADWNSDSAKAIISALLEGESS